MLENETLLWNSFSSLENILRVESGIKRHSCHKTFSQSKLSRRPHVGVFGRKGNFKTLGRGENSRSVSSHGKARHSPACAQKHVCYSKHEKQAIVYFSYCHTQDKPDRNAVVH